MIYMLKTLTWFLMFATPLIAIADNTLWQEQVYEIDQEIRQLEDRKIKALGRANRLEDKAIRWQFMQDQKSEARRAYVQADTAREEARMIQTQIDLLERTKQKILAEHGMAQ